ncbi:MAG: Fibronectin type domain protein [Verrucomicrobiales bacterium]|nr:Fibronectin type domain protein [Verrucomicrobiales bacterium]
MEGLKLSRLHRKRNRPFIWELSIPTPIDSVIPFSILKQISLLLLLPCAGLAVDVTLEWNPNPEPDIVGYRIYYISLPGSSLQQIETGNQTRAVLSGLPAGKSWLALAVAQNAFGLESAPSNLLFFDSGSVPEVPAAEVQLSLSMSVSPMSALLSYIPPSTAEQETDTGKWPDSADSSFVSPPEVPAGNNFLTVSSTPESQSLFTGDTTVLGVPTAATGPASWQWLHNGKPLPGAVFPTLTIGPASPAEAGNYQVQIIMEKTEILTEPAVISVWPRPTLTISRGPDRLNPEENGLEVLVSGGPLQPLSLEFSENLTDWSLLEAFQLDDQGTRTIPDQTKMARQRFYRLRARE